MRAGSWGASQGAKIAQSKKRETNTTPTAASGLWRATRGSEMAKADTMNFENLLATLLLLLDARTFGSAGQQDVGSNAQPDNVECG